MLVEPMLDKISSREFSEWMAYDRVEPFGDERADLRIGVLSSLTANIHRDKKKRSEAYSPLDFMPVVRRNQMYECTRKRMSGRRVADQLRSIFSLASKKNG